MKSILDQYPLRLRPAQLYDSLITYKWAMDPIVRQNSGSNETFSFEHHYNWFLKKINDPNSKYFILDSFCPAGSVRLDKGEEGIVFSIVIDSNFRGLGLGSSMVKLAMEYNGEGKYIAYIKNDNYASLKIFRNLPFKEGQIDPSTNLIKFEYEIN